MAAACMGGLGSRLEAAEPWSMLIFLVVDSEQITSKLHSKLEHEHEQVQVQLAVICQVENLQNVCRLQKLGETQMAFLQERESITSEMLFKAMCPGGSSVLCALGSRWQPPWCCRLNIFAQAVCLISAHNLCGYLLCLVGGSGNGTDAP